MARKYIGPLHSCFFRGQIVILDEAHNIEDSARDAASWNVTQDQIRDAMQDLEAVASNGSQDPDSHR